MDERLMQFRIGVMVLASLICVAILGTLFGPHADFTGMFQLNKKYTIKIQFDEAPGVRENTPIHKSGIVIGRVTEVELIDQGAAAMVVAKIDEDRKIFDNEVCRINRSLLGDSALEFIKLADDLAKQLALGPGAATPDELLDQPSPSNPAQTLREQFDDLNNRIREVFKLRRIERIEGPCGGYAHHHFLKERLNLQDAIVIPNAIFPEQFGMVKHADKDAINLVTIHGFYFKDKAKGILDVLEVLDSLPEEVRKNINYTVVGGGPYLKEVMAEAKKYNVNVQFTGMLPSPREVLEGSDIFIYYSHHDNFPIVILEAMACGLPVVTNSVGAVGEIIQHEKDGFIVNNHHSYAEYLIQLIKDSELRTKVGEKARKAVEARFNWETVIDEYIDIYQKLI